MPDFLVIGGGIIGVAVARELRRRHPDATVAVLEKEPACGRHASGRNSGVLHAGFYYTADSLKARFTRDGNAALREYCRAKGLPLNECGKLVVAKSAADHPQMDELLRRGAANGVALESITEAEARRIEPRVKTCERAIWSPNTATADPGAVIAAMRDDAEREGVRFALGTAFRRLRGNEIETSQDRWSAGYVVNCAGLHFSAGFEFRRLAVEELAKYNRRHLVSLAGQLAEGVRVETYRRWGRSGIRAQLLDTRTKKLEMDFVLEGDERSMHVLNAVSPGWTCSIPFARHVVTEIERLQA